VVGNGTIRKSVPIGLL